MKKLLFLGAIIPLFLSCSKDDNDNNQQTTTVFEIPLETGNYWTYNVSAAGSPNTRDSLYVGDNNVINNITYKKMLTKNDVATGFYSNTLRNNSLRVSGNSILLTGDLSVSATQNLPVNIDLNLEDFIIFDADKTEGETLSSKSGNFQQTFNGYPMTIYYTLKSVAGNYSSTFTSPNSQNYSNVKLTKIIVTAKVDTSVSGFPVNVLPEQDVIVSEQYTAKNLGVVYTKTVNSYTLNSSLPSSITNQLGIPTSQTQTQEEFLDTYQVN